MSRPDDKDPGTTPSLNPDDKAAIDAMLADGPDAAADSAAGDDRAQAAASLLSTLDAWQSPPLTDEERQTLVDATMARIRRDEADRRDRMKLENQPIMLGRGLRFRIAEGLAVAAVIAMATATIWSVATDARDRSMSAVSRKHLGEMHAGLTAFKADNGALPTDSAPKGVARMMGPSQGASMLDIPGLARREYCDPGTLSNPRRPGVGKGFSFAVFSVSNLPHLNHATVVLVGDRNPALEGMLQGQSFDEAVSSCRWHARLLRHPSVLFADGHARDLPDGAHEGDNVWAVDAAPTPRDATQKAPIELFLAH